MMDEVWRDARYVMRQLARSPGVTAIAVLTLGTRVDPIGALRSE